MSEAKVEVLKTVLALAYADGEMSSEEERLVDFLIDSNGLTPEQQERVRAKHDGEVDLARLGELVTDADERAKAYEIAALVAKMDGVQDSAESEMLSKLREALVIGGAAAWEIEAKAEKIYQAFTKRQQAGGEEEEA